MDLPLYGVNLNGGLTGLFTDPYGTAGAVTCSMPCGFKIVARWGSRDMTISMSSSMTSPGLPGPGCRHFTTAAPYYLRVVGRRPGPGAMMTTTHGSGDADAPLTSRLVPGGSTTKLPLGFCRSWAQNW